MVNVLSGGAHAGRAVDVQDVLVVPLAATTFGEAIEHAALVRAPCDLDALALEPRPHGVVKLEDETNLWRIRVGAYRILFKVHDEILLVLVVKIADRREAYR